jgi:hypothetical protein
LLLKPTLKVASAGVTTFEVELGAEVPIALVAVTVKE